MTFELAVLLLALAALADILTSYRGFKKGAVEVNPIIAKLFGKRPSFAALTAVKLLTGGFVVYFGTPTTILIVAGIWGLVALHNWKTTK